MINPTPSSVDPALPIESDSKIADVFLVSTDCSRKVDISSHTTVPSPSTEVIFFDRNNITKTHLPLDIPFQISVGVSDKDIFHTIVEGASISILSSTAWQVIGSPQLVPTTEKILVFNRRPTRPLGIILQLPITLERKIVYINVMVVQGPLDFNLLLGEIMSMP